MTVIRADATAVSDALDPIRGSMSVDGYTLEVEQASDDGLVVRVTALENACEECLAPTEVLRMILSGQLKGQYAPEEIDLILPAHQ